MVYHSCCYIFIFVMFVLGLKLNCLFFSCLMALKYKERIFFYLSLPLFFSRPTLPHVFSLDAWETDFFLRYYLGTSFLFQIMPGNRLRRPTFSLLLLAEHVAAVLGHQLVAPYFWALQPSHSAAAQWQVGTEWRRSQLPTPIHSSHSLPAQGHALVH